MAAEEAAEWPYTNNRSARLMNGSPRLMCSTRSAANLISTWPALGQMTPWIPARRFLTCHGLAAPWSGYVWMNPPFGPRNGIVPWLEKFFAHGNGIALVPDRTSAPWWQQFAPRAELILFVSPKIKFIAANGAPGCAPAQGTSLLAVGHQGVAALRRAADNGLGVLMAPVSAP
jgi:hypothetical protein